MTNQTVLATRDCGMNWEIAAVYQSKLDNVLKEANEILETTYGVTLETKLESKEKSDGGPYESNKADFWYLSVVANGTVPAGLKQGAEDMLNAVSI